MAPPPFPPKGDKGPPAPGGSAPPMPSTEGTGGDDAMDALTAAMADSDLGAALKSWTTITLTKSPDGVEVDVDGTKGVLPSDGGGPPPAAA